jgi:hypothetical protein
MPATQATIWALDGLDIIANKPYEPLPDPVRMSQNYRAIDKRLSAKDKAVLIQEVKKQGIYAYAKHFGDWNSGVTYTRLLLHWSRGGQFPPTRQELNDILLEF